MNWKESQKEWIDKYKDAVTPRGFFSVNGVRGATLTGEMINDTIPGGLCLDVGCGILPKPSYMEVAQNVTFIGIDPYRGRNKRKFPFVEGMAENLPFNDKVFNGVLFATSLNHLKDPGMGISEAHRVLKHSGFLFIWNGMRESDNSHLWSFTRESLIEMIDGFHEVRSMYVRKRHNNESIILLRKC